MGSGNVLRRMSLSRKAQSYNFSGMDTIEPSIVGVVVVYWKTWGQWKLKAKETLACI